MKINLSKKVLIDKLSQNYHLWKVSKKSAEFSALCLKMIFRPCFFLFFPHFASGVGGFCKVGKIPHFFLKPSLREGFKKKMWNFPHFRGVAGGGADPFPH